MDGYEVSCSIKEVKDGLVLLHPEIDHGIAGTMYVRGDLANGEPLEHGYIAVAIAKGENSTLVTRSLPVTQDPGDDIGVSRRMCGEALTVMSERIVAGVAGWAGVHIYGMKQQ